MTDRMKAALKWLSERGGSGVVDRYGRVVAQGEVSRAFSEATFLRLVAAGRLAGSEGRLFITDSGRAVLTEGADE